MPANRNRIIALKSKGLSDESIKFPVTSGDSLNPEIHFSGTKMEVEFDGSCLKQEKRTFKHKSILNVFFVYEYIYGHTIKTLLL